MKTATKNVKRNLEAQPDNQGLQNALDRLIDNKERFDARHGTKPTANQPSRIQPVDWPERTESVQRPERVEKPERVERPERPEHVDRPEPPGRSHRR